MKIKVSDYVAKFLYVQETTHVYEVAGGMITHFLDSIYTLGKTKIISMHHEQATAFAADAYGRATRRPGVAFATSGPGATNLVTGIASCYFDSSPALFITGQVNTHEQKKTLQIRQLGFQETDIVSMAKPITKKCFTVTDASEIESTLKSAYKLTMENRPGPVLIDIPMNIQNAIISVNEVEYISQQSTLRIPTSAKLINLINAIKNAKKPLILAGNGINCANAKYDFLKFIELTKIPVVTSLLAIDILPYHHPLRVGLIGSYGNRWANITLANADLLIVIGSRLDIRQTGADVKGFSQEKIIFHIDCDKHEINNRIKNCVPIHGDIKETLRQIITNFQQPEFSHFNGWVESINNLRKEWPDTKELKNFPGINPNELMHELSRNAKNFSCFFADVGNHQMWAAQSLELTADQQFITSGGMGAMGFSLPAAIGYCLAKNNQPVIVIAGDGSFQMNIQELQTIVRNKLPIKIIIINNQILGMIRQFQDSYFDGRYQSTYWGYNAPDFAAIANAYQIPALTIKLPKDVNHAIKWLCANPHEPALLQVMISPKMNVYPKIAFGKPISEMEPMAKPQAIEST